MSDPRKHTHCAGCGRALPPRIGGNSARTGQLYRFCSPECRDTYRKAYWHRWYVANVKATKAVARAGRAAAGFLPVERRRV